MLRFFHSPSTKTVQRGCASVARNFAALKNATTFAYVSGIKVASAASAPGAMSLAINRLTNPILLNDFIRCFQVISNPGVVMTGTGDPCNAQGLGRAADKKRGQARCRHASQILHGWPAVNRSKRMPAFGLCRHCSRRFSRDVPRFGTSPPRIKRVAIHGLISPWLTFGAPRQLLNAPHFLASHRSTDTTTTPVVQRLRAWAESRIGSQDVHPPYREALPFNPPGKACGICCARERDLRLCHSGTERGMDSSIAACARAFLVR